MQPTQKPEDALTVFWGANRAKPKRKKRFTDLPGEIRNQIYDYVFSAITLVCLMGPNHLIAEASHPSKERTIKFSGTLGKGTSFRCHNTKWATSVTGLHLVNKQIARECLGYLYNSIVLFSNTSRRLINWIQTVHPRRLALLTQLYLDHVTYGDPKFFDDNIWKGKSDHTWAEACRLAVKAFTHLTKLVINIEVHDVPFRFGLEEHWVQPLLYFKHLQELKEVEVHVFSRCRRRTKLIDLVNAPPFYINEVVAMDNGRIELHELFGLAVSMKILGYCDECCLEELRDALLGRWSSIRAIPIWSHIASDTQ